MKLTLKGRAWPGAMEPGAAGMSVSFSVSFIDPPAAGVNMQVEFVLNHRAAAAKPAAHGPAEPHAAPSVGEHAAEHGGDHAEHLAPAGPLPEAAKALPADSPYALPPAHSAPHG